MGITAKGKKNAGLLTEGSIAKGILVICHSIIFRPAAAAVLQCGRCMGCGKLCR